VRSLLIWEPGRGSSVELVAGDLHAPHELRVLAVDQQVQVTVDELAGRCQMGGLGRQLVELNGQRLTRVTARHADGVEVLYVPQHRLHIVAVHLPFGRQRGLDLLQRAAEVAVVTHGIDNRLGDCQITLGELRQTQLPEQMLPQAGITVGLVLEEVAVVLPGRLAVGGGAVVDVVPAGVDREIVRHVIAHLDVALGGIHGVVTALGVCVAVVALALVAVRLLQVPFLVGLEHEVGVERLLDLRAQFERGQLQQPYRLLQLRRHRELLAESKL